MIAKVKKEEVWNETRADNRGASISENSPNEVTRSGLIGRGSLVTQCLIERALSHRLVS